LIYALPTLFNINHSVAVFFDNGWVYAEKGNYTTNDSFVLNDAGVSYNIHYRKLFCSVQLAKPIGKTTGVTDPGTQFLLQFGATL
jgi:hemolysin activation/secretion protein